MRALRARKEMEDLPKDLQLFLVQSMADCQYQDACCTALRRSTRDPIVQVAIDSMIDNSIEYHTKCQFTTLRFICDDNMMTNELRTRKLPLFIFCITQMPYKEAEGLIEDHGKERCGDPSCFLELVLSPRLAS